jgi:CDP-diacylglycerol--glycerol-3-phosphate 3-phosphatidyltransferase
VVPGVAFLPGPFREVLVIARALKPRVLSLLGPLTRLLVRAGIGPNTLTFVGFTVSCLAGVLYAVGPLHWAALTFLLAGLFDILDGAVAREGNRASRFGAFLDSNVDRFAEIVVFVGILWRCQDEPLTLVAVLLAITGSLMGSYTKARAEGLGEGVDGGLLQRPERIVLLALGSFFGEIGLRVTIWVLAGLTNATSVQRMVLVATSMAAAGEADRAESDPVTVEAGEV